MSKTKLKIAILGTGNVAYHLHLAIGNCEMLEFVQVYGRNKAMLKDFKAPSKVSSLKGLIPADVYILAINDDAIATVAKALTSLEGLVVHTSGAKSIIALESLENYGVFYPLQSFTKGVDVDFRNIPICIEANTKQHLKTLQHLAEALTPKVFHIDSKQREVLHLSAVFVNNFTNFMYIAAEELCASSDIPFETLLPLLEETALKTFKNSPQHNQTGPAKRGDTHTIQQHLELLKESQYLSLYRELTLQIKKKYNS